MLREFVLFVNILAVANCQVCCFNCYCPKRAGTLPGGGGSELIYIVVPGYGFEGLSGLGSFAGLGGFTGFRGVVGLGGLGTSYGPAVNDLCPVGVNIGGQCYGISGSSTMTGWQTWSGKKK